MSVKYDLTTDHPSSSYGFPVLIHKGKAYGPQDIVAETFMGEARTAADIVANDLYEISGPKVDAGLAKMFLSSSPRHTRSAMLAEAEVLDRKGGVFSPMLAEAIRAVWAGTGK